MTEKKVKAWHFVNGEGRTLCYDAHDMLVKAGYIYSMDPEDNLAPSLCYRGMHGSRKIFQAFDYAQSTILSRVTIWGDIEEGCDKLCGRHRQVHQVLDIKRPLIKVMKEIIDLNRRRKWGLDPSYLTPCLERFQDNPEDLWYARRFLYSSTEKDKLYAEKYLASLFERV